MTFRPSLIASAVLICHAPAALSAGAALPVDVALDPDHPALFNRPRVTVTVCEAAPQPGSMTGCVEVPNVLLDTGSTGLVLSAVALPRGAFLPPAPHAKGLPRRDIHYCGRFRSDVVWGHAISAWVGLGDLYTTRPIGIALLRPLPDDRPSGCRPPWATGDNYSVNDLPAGINGILGVAPSPNTCSLFRDGLCPTSDDHAPFYEREHGRKRRDKGGWKPVVPPPELELVNPVAAFPVGANDGVVLHMGALGPAEHKAARATGTLHLGVEAWSGELFPRPTQRIDLKNPMRLLPATIDHPKRASSCQAAAWPDSGTSYIMAPKAFSVSVPAKGPASWSLWLDSNTAADAVVRHGPYDLRFVGPGGGSGTGARRAAVETVYKSGNVLLLGMPFFYGRSIAFGIAEDPRQVLDRTPAPGFLMIGDTAAHG